MLNKYEKYAELLLKKCLNVSKNQPLLVYFPTESYDFVRVLAKKAYELGVNDIYFDPYDDILKRDQLINLSDEEIKNSSLFNKDIWNTYSLKGGAILILLGDDPDIMYGVDPEKIKLSQKLIQESKKVYREMQNKNEVAWNIACVSTERWAKKVFPESPNPKEDLWNVIFDICNINKEIPIDEWNNFFEVTRERYNLLNNLKFKEFHYRNSLGTDFTCEYSEDTIWSGGEEELKNGKTVVMNMPTIEVFTSPMYKKTNGIVYSSMPLVYNGSIIDEFWIKFKDGKVIDYDAKEGKEILKTIIETDENSMYLGETALVEYDSAISNANILFYETLFDENASCHIALGTGFGSSIKGGIYMSDEELLENGVNVSKAHVDFMIGTKDLSIIGTTFDGKTVEVFKDGKFSLREI